MDWTLFEWVETLHVEICVCNGCYFNKTGTYHTFLSLFSLWLVKEKPLSAAKFLLQHSTTLSSFFSLIFVVCRRRKMKEQGEVDLNFGHFIINLKKGGVKKEKAHRKRNGRKNPHRSPQREDPLSNPDKDPEEDPQWKWLREEPGIEPDPSHEEESPQWNQ